MYSNNYQVCELKAVYKPKVKASDRYSIKNSKEAYGLLINEIYDKDTVEYKEFVYLILLNARYKVLGISKISEGGTELCPVDLKVIFQTALLGNANSIMLSHNHPSGDVVPSRPDDTLTENVKNGCKTLGIHFLDHLIVATDKYYSYSDEGRL